jgi:hypothetical protein
MQKGNAGNGKKRRSPNEQIIQTALTWGHVITMSVLALAAILNIGGFFAIVFKPEIAEKLTAYAEKWQTLYIAGILGYDAKSTVENTLKITKSIKEMQSLQTEETDEATASESNG